MVPRDPEAIKRLRAPRTYIKNSGPKVVLVLLCKFSLYQAAQTVRLQPLQHFLPLSLPNTFAGNVFSTKYSILTVSQTSSVTPKTFHVSQKLSHNLATVGEIY